MVGKRSITLDRTSGLSGQDIRTFQNRTSGLSRSGNRIESKSLIFSIKNSVFILGFNVKVFPNIICMIIHIGTNISLHKK